MKNKYDFDLILSDEVMKANRERHIEKDNTNKFFIGLAIALFIVIGLVIHDDIATYNKIKAKCDLEGKEVIETHRYDGEKVYTCNK